MFRSAARMLGRGGLYYGTQLRQISVQRACIQPVRTQRNLVRCISDNVFDPCGTKNVARCCTASSATSTTRSNSLAGETGIVEISYKTLEKLESVLEYKFKDKLLLVQAMIHRSVISKGGHNTTVFYSNKNKESTEVTKNNERLEVLGDKVFGLLVVDQLYRQKSFSEGEISVLTHSLVSRKAALNYSKIIGLDPFLAESQVLQGTLGSRHGDFFEALLGAVFVDGGFSATHTFFSQKVIPIWDRNNLTPETVQCKKQELQELLGSCGLCVGTLGKQLQYKQLHADFRKPFFTQCIELFGRRVSVASGSTRISADQEAASRLLERLKKAKATCFLIRLARNAKDEKALQILQSVRAREVEASVGELSCPPSSSQK